MPETKSSGITNPHAPRSQLANILILALAFIMKAAIKALEYVLERGVTIKAQRRSDPDGKKYIWVDIRLNSIDYNPSNTSTRDDDNDRPYYTSR